MQNWLLIWIEIGLIVNITLQCEPVKIGTRGLDNQESKFVEAKDSLIRMGKGYIKRQPLSTDLWNYIRRSKLKRKRKRSERYQEKKSHSNPLSNKNIYVYQDGEVVPYHPDFQENVRLKSKFTVVPLVIPLHDINTEAPKQFIRSSYSKNEISSAERNFKDSSLEPLHFKFPLPPFQDDEPASLKTSVKSLYNDPFLPYMSLSSTKKYSLDNIITDTPENLLNLSKDKLQKLLSDETDIRIVQRGKKEKVVSENTSASSDQNTEMTEKQATAAEVAHKNIKNGKPIAVEQHSSSTDSTEDEALEEILDDIEGLIEIKKLQEGYLTSFKEGTHCSPEGEWLSQAAGKKINIHMKGCGTEALVNMTNRTTPKRHGFMSPHCDWNFRGDVPFPHTGMLSLYGFPTGGANMIALFLGECMVCEGLEEITGTWLIRRKSKDCNDQKAAEEIISDIWRKDNIREIREMHIEEAENNKTAPLCSTQAP